MKPYTKIEHDKRSIGINNCVGFHLLQAQKGSADTTATLFLIKKGLAHIKALIYTFGSI